MSIVDNWNKNYINNGLDPLMNDLNLHSIPNDDNKMLFDHGYTIPKVPFDDDCDFEEENQMFIAMAKGLMYKGKYLPRYYILKSERPQQLAHIDEKVWYRYAEQIESSEGFDIIDFPGAFQGTPIVPMNLQTNPEAISRAKAIADSAINFYNNHYYKSFVIVSVDKANCNPELSSYVDSDKYIVLYKRNRGCFCNGDASNCFCLKFEDMFYITFTAKEENSGVVKVFQAKAVREVDEDKESVIFCRESSPDPPSQDEKKVAEARKQCHQNFLENIQKSGLSLLDQPFYPDLEVKNVDIPYVSAIKAQQDLEKFYSFLP